MSNGPVLTAYDYFRAGRDTDDIRRIMKITEAEALKQVTLQRSAALGLGNPYSPDCVEKTTHRERLEQMRKVNRYWYNRMWGR